MLPRKDLNNHAVQKVANKLRVWNNENLRLKS